MYFIEFGFDCASVKKCCKYFDKNELMYEMSLDIKRINNAQRRIISKSDDVW